MKRLAPIGSACLVAVLFASPVGAAELAPKSLEAGPDVPGSVTCIFCSQCADPTRMRTYNFPSEGEWILFIAESCGTVYDCEDAIQCEAEEEQEQEEAQLALLADLVETGDVPALVDFVSQQPGWTELVPERGLLLARGGCGDVLLELYELNGQQVNALLGTRAVAVAFQD